MGIDSSRIYLEKNFPNIVGQIITVSLMNALSLPVGNE
jgi:hypothetical protein